MQLKCLLWCFYLDVTIFFILYVIGGTEYKERLCKVVWRRWPSNCCWVRLQHAARRHFCKTTSFGATKHTRLISSHAEYCFAIPLSGQLARINAADHGAAWLRCGFFVHPVGTDADLHPANNAAAVAAADDRTSALICALDADTNWTWKSWCHTTSSQRDAFILQGNGRSSASDQNIPKWIHH